MVCEIVELGLSEMRTNPLRVGFIGIGAMGAPMARNLMKAGFQVVAFDVSKKALVSIKRDGADAASNPRALAKACSVIITMLPSPEAVRDVVFGDEGILSAISESHLMIEMSTIDLKLTLELSEGIERRGGMFLDAPVAGTPDRAETRDLEILVSGNDRSVFERFANLFDAMGKRVIYVGKAGNGKIIKLTVNAMIAINKLAAVEATSIALKNDINPDMLFDIVRNSTADSVVFERYGKTILGEKTPITTRHSWHLKDLQLMENLCRESSSSFPLGSLAHEIIQSSINEETDRIETLGAMIDHYKRIDGLA